MLPSFERPWRRWCTPIESRPFNSVRNRCDKLIRKPINDQVLSETVTLSRSEKRNDLFSQLKCKTRNWKKSWINCRDKGLISTPSEWFSSRFSSGEKSPKSKIQGLPTKIISSYANKPKHRFWEENRSKMKCPNSGPPLPINPRIKWRSSGSDRLDA